MNKADNFGYTSVQELSALLYNNNVVNKEIQNLENKA